MKMLLSNSSVCFGTSPEHVSHVFSSEVRRHEEARGGDVSDRGNHAPGFGAGRHPGPAKKGAKGTIELIESKDGKYRFSVRDADGKYVGGSAVGHATEKEAREAAEELKKVLATATYVSKKSEDSKKGKDKDKDEK